MRLSAVERAIERTVLYASLFEYPLTLAQLRKTLIEAEQTETGILRVYAGSPRLRSAIGYRDGYFFPIGREDLVDKRRAREVDSLAFLQRHARFLRVIGGLPYVRMVALSGSVAHLNLEDDGDLDLFIVTRGRHVWSVTVAVLVFAKLLRCRRRVCANFTVADSRLAFDQRDLFTANQIIHLWPLVGRDMLRDLVAANPFVTRFYPNFRATDVAPLPVPAPRRAWTGWLESGLRGPSAAVEVLCRWLYGRHLRRQARSWLSPEQVRLDDDCLKLHTRSHRRSILERFEAALGRPVARDDDAEVIARVAVR